MKRVSARWLGVGGDAGLAARCGFLLAWMLALAVPVSIVGYWLYGPIGVAASAAAAACCLAGAVPPLILAHWLHDPQFAMHHAIIGMLSRMAIPLGIGLLVFTQQGALSRAGFMIDLVVYFWVGLLFDTLSLVAASHASPRTPAKSG